MKGTEDSIMSGLINDFSQNVFNTNSEMLNTVQNNYKRAQNFLRTAIYTYVSVIHLHSLFITFVAE
jgi:hypothetical protein